MEVPKAFIKKIALEIPPSYQLDNTPFDEHKTAKEAPPFLGRKEHRAKFLAFLNNDSKKGVFLVTGHRGMGKTSFVHQVIHDYKKGKNVCDIHITLAQNNPREMDILRLMVASAKDRYSTYLRKYRRKNIDQVQETIKKSKYGLFGCIVLFVLPWLLIWRHDFIYWFINHNLLNGLINHPTLRKIVVIILAVSLLSGIVGSSFWIFKILYYKYKETKLKGKDSAQNRINLLSERCNAAVSEEIGHDDTISFQDISTSLLGGSEKKTKQFPIADIKQIEYELQQFLEKCKDELEFIFIFDELDKVDPAISTSYYYSDLESFERSKFDDAYLRDLRDRKQAIINTISGLKNFLTTAQARFIFIAGREMFDASMADIADRQSSISSIFTYIFNIESFLKEKIEKKNSKKDEGKTDDFWDGNNASLTIFIEEYLRLLLFPEKEGVSLFKAAKEQYDDKDFGKIYFILQNFVVYLAYRSNGSPKKLIKAVQEFIKVVDSAAAFSPDKTIIARPNAASGNGSNKYLYFNYYNQYRIGFITYLYRPFLIQFGRSSKLYSDNIIVSTPYLFDHLLKFHPFAFSLTNLELIPEVLSTNRTPSLRKHITQIIDYLGTNHIRKTDIGLFDYKFYSRTLNEITFLSKVFEQESAAFNFTLDESYLVKLHIRSKIKELRSIYAKFLTSTDSANPQIFSIAHLNGILGDLHFFDQEYDDAIAAYSDAIRPINQIKVQTMNMRDFMTLIRNKLKLGLCFEKINAYEEALAFYSDICQDAKRFMVYRIREAKEINPVKELPADAKKRNEIYHTSSLSDLLQTIIQGFIAKITIQEKMSVEGINAYKLSMTLGDFLLLAQSIPKNAFKNYLIQANLFLLTGKVLYFKNSMSGFEKEDVYSNTLPEPYSATLRKLIDNFNQEFAGENDRSNRRKPTMALYMYIIGLSMLLEPINNKPNLVDEMVQQKNMIPVVLCQLEAMINHNHQRASGMDYRYMATFLSCIGDCLLGIYYNSNRKYNDYAISSLFRIEDPAPEEGLHFFLKAVTSEDKDNFPICDIIKCYYLSGQLFLKYGRTVSCSFQYRKILYLLRMIVTKDNDKDRRKPTLVFLDKNIVIPILKITSQNAGFTDRHMINKAVDHLGVDRSYALNNLSNHAESREAVLLYNYIKIKSGEMPPEEEMTILINSQNSFATQFARLLELDLFSKYRFVQIEKEIFKKEKTIWNKSECSHARDYLFGRLNILRTLKIYGTDYMLGLSYFAYTHYHVADFLNKTKKHMYLDAPKEEGSFHEKLKKEMEQVLGKGSYSAFDISYHYLMAKQLYSKAIQLHTAGVEYKNAISQLIYLEDDFNDNAYHFGAALDRYMMSYDVFIGRIEECDKNINDKNTITPEDKG